MPVVSSCLTTIWLLGTNSKPVTCPLGFLVTRAKLLPFSSMLVARANLNPHAVMWSLGALLRSTLIRLSLYSIGLVARSPAITRTAVNTSELRKAPIPTYRPLSLLVMLTSASKNGSLLSSRGCVALFVKKLIVSPPFVKVDNDCDRDQGRADC